MAIKKAQGPTAHDDDVPRETLPDYDEFIRLLGDARLALAVELKRATNLAVDGMDVAYAERLANVLSTLRDI